MLHYLQIPYHVCIMTCSTKPTHTHPPFADIRRCRAAINSTDPIAQLPPCPTDATASELLSRLWIEALRDPYPPESAAAGSSGASHSADAHAPHDFTTLEKYAWRALEAQSGAEVRSCHRFWSGP